MDHTSRFSRNIVVDSQLIVFSRDLTTALVFFFTFSRRKPL